MMHVYVLFVVAADLQGVPGHPLRPGRVHEGRLVLVWGRQVPPRYLHGPLLPRRSSRALITGREPVPPGGGEPSGDRQGPGQAVPFWEQGGG